MRRELDGRVRGRRGIALQERWHRSIHYTCGLDVPELRSGCQAIKAQRRVAMLNHARALEAVEPFGQLHLSVMFDDHQAPRSNEVRCIEKFEDAHMLALLFVGRIEKNEIRDQMTRRKLFQPGQSLGFDQFGAATYPETREIPASEPRRLRIRLDEDYLAPSSANRFDADSARPGIQIDEKRICNGGPDNVK